MRFWIRELAGWLLVGLGLFVFYICLALLYATDQTGRPAPRLIEAAVLMVIGIFVFRGGIHLLKVAMAARLLARGPAAAGSDCHPEAAPVVSHREGAGWNGVPPVRTGQRPVPPTPQLCGGRPLALRRSDADPDQIKPYPVRQRHQCP